MLQEVGAPAAQCFGVVGPEGQFVGHPQAGGGRAEAPVTIVAEDEEDAATKAANTGEMVAKVRALLDEVTQALGEHLRRDAGSLRRLADAQGTVHGGLLGRDQDSLDS